MPRDTSQDPRNNPQWKFYKAPDPGAPPAPVVPPNVPKYSDKSFLHTPMAAIVVPLLISFVTALAIMAGTATFIYLIRGYEYERPVLAAGVTTFVVTWLSLQFRWITLTRLEEMTGIEMDGRPGLGSVPQTGSVRVQVDTITPQGHMEVSEVYDLPATPEQLYLLCLGLHDQGKSLAEKEWSPIEAGKPFSIDGIRKLKAEMLKRGIIVYVNSKSKAQGYTETVVGRRIIESWRKFGEEE